MCKKLTIPIFVLVVGWAITPAQAHCKGTAEHQFTHKNCGGGVRGGGDDRYSAKVHFADSACGEGGDHFCSDNGVDSSRGDYFDNVDNVAAGGGKGPFELNLRHGTFRRFFLDFSNNCVTGPDTCGEVPVLTNGLTGPSNQEGGNGYVFAFEEEGFSLLDMAPGDMKPRLVSIRFNDFNNNAWRLSFDPDVCTGSNPVSVTRLDADHWDFVSAEGIACLERAKNGTKGPPILQGGYRVSFKFTVELWP